MTEKFLISQRQQFQESFHFFGGGGKQSIWINQLQELLYNH